MAAQRVTVRFNAQVIERAIKGCSSVQILSLYVTQKLIVERLVSVLERS